jgi:hypothetical protein
LPVLLVCEEAHRYIPAADRKGFYPTRQALARIAKEGRKYGVSLALDTQRWATPYMDRHKLEEAVARWPGQGRR